jgi:hypothetical protein
MAEWQAHARAQSDYQYALFFDLEAQRATRHAELCAALRSQPAIVVDLEGWCRLVNFKHSLAGLSPAGSLKRSGRFNFGEDIDPARFTPFPALYLAEDFETAFREYHGLSFGHRTDGLTPEELSLEDDGSWVTLRIRGHVNNVFDATKTRNLRQFSSVISKFKLSDRVRQAESVAQRGPTTLIRGADQLMQSLQDPNWRSLPIHFDIPSNSQLFGKFLVDAGYEGVLYRSTRSSKRCLAVFTRQLANSDSSIALHEDRPSTVDYCELNASNCGDI